MPIERFRGNRFNILFSNAASVYFLISKLKEFLQGNDTNRLLKSVKFDINKHEYVAGWKALGLIAFLITVPLWQVIEDRTIHVLDSSIYYREILEFMESTVEDTDSFMSGRSFLSFCNRRTIVNDTIFQS